MSCLCNCKNRKKINFGVGGQPASEFGNTGLEKTLRSCRMIRFDFISCFFEIRFDGVSGVATDKQQLLWAQVAVLATLEIALYFLGENYFFEQL